MAIHKPDNASIEISNFVTKGCLSNRECAEEAPKICAAVDLTLSSGGHPPSIGGLLRSGRIAPRSCRASISSRTIWNGAYPEEAPERDDFSSNRHPAPAFCWSMISGQPLRVCPEGKPVPTHWVVAQGHAFPDHARGQPPMDLTFNIELRPGWR